VVDEAHHLLPVAWEPAPLTIPQGTYGMMLITMQPEHVSPALLEIVDTVIAIGEAPETTIGSFCRAVRETGPACEVVALETGEGLLWSRREGGPPVWFRSLPPRAERRRHRRKYAEGEISAERSFFFRGPEDKLNLRAQNLVTFLQLSDGVDDETWLHHLRRGDYSYWFREVIGDEELSEEAAEIERARALSPAESRARIRAAVEERYTSPP